MIRAAPPAADRRAALQAPPSPPWGGMGWGVPGRWSSAAAVLGLSTVPAAAEVCDKLRPDWSPDDGPPGTTGDLLAALGTPLGMLALAALGLALAAIFATRRPLVLVATSFGLPMAVAVLLHQTRDPAIDTLALQEGCLSSPDAVQILLFVAMLVLVPVAFHRAFNR